jgi:hypothetical protein
MAKDKERVCVGCSEPEKGGNLQREDDNQLRCRQCSATRRVDQCPVKPTDLRGICRRADTCLTVVTIHMDWQTSVEWLRFGEAQLRHREHDGTDELKAFLTEGVTDFEHDSAYALSLPLIALRFESLDYHSTRLSAWVHPDDSDAFRVPRPGYDPMKHPKARICSSRASGSRSPRSSDALCGKPHVIVPEGHYLPPRDAQLYSLVKGKRVEIRITQPSEE